MSPTVLFIPLSARSFMASLGLLPETTSLPLPSLRLAQYLFTYTLCVWCNKRNDVTLEYTADSLCQSVSALESTSDEHWHAATTLIRVIIFVQMPGGIAAVCLSSHDGSRRMTVVLLRHAFIRLDKGVHSDEIPKLLSTCRERMEWVRPCPSSS